MMSNSRLTLSPAFRDEKFVCSNVYGMIVTEKASSDESTTVRLTPFTQTDPLATVTWPEADGYEKRKFQLPSRASTEDTVPVVSTWPCTMCPSSRSPIFIQRSRLTREPSFHSPISVRSRVSSTATTSYSSPSMFTTVRHTPLCATLWSIFNSFAIGVRSLMRTFPPSLRIPDTVATVSMMPVSMLLKVNG